MQALTAFPFTSKVTYDAKGWPVLDRAVGAEVLRNCLSNYFSNGVFLTANSRCLQVSASNASMNVTIEAGAGLINGVTGYIETETELSLDVGDALLPRIDTVVLRLNDNTDFRNLYLDVIKGTPSSEPKAPALTQTKSIWEIGLANVRVSANATIVSNTNITDTRLDSSRCGQVNAIEKIDTEAFMQQLQAFETEEKEAILEWFENIQEQLSGDVAVNLQLEVNGLKAVTNKNTNAINNMFVDETNLSVATSAWKSDSTYASAGYSYRADISVEGTTSDMIPEVVLAPANDLDMIAPFATTDSGVVSLYASEIPSTTVSASRITLRKKVAESTEGGSQGDDDTYDVVVIKGYFEEAKQYADDARIIKDSIQSSLDDIYETKETSATHTEKISALSEDIAQNFQISTIQPTATGDTVSLNDSAEYPIQELHLFGKSTQNGTPTPENPVDIVNVVNPTVKVTDGADAEQTATVAATLCGINDVKDELIVYADGSGKLVKNYKLFSTSDLIKFYWIVNPGWSPDNTISAYTTNIEGNADITKNDYVNGKYSLCNCFISTSIANVPNKYSVTKTNKEQMVLYIVLDSKGKEKTSENFKDLLKELDIKLLMAVKQTVTDISAEQVQALHTYYPSTTITADGAGVAVKYVADPTLYIDNKYAELSAAIIASASEAE